MSKRTHRLLFSLVALTATFGVHSGVHAEDAGAANAWKIPRALRRGDTIALVAPAGPVTKAPILAYAAQLEKAGFQVLLPTDLERRQGYLAGTDDERVAELNAALHNPRVAAILACRGGYGLTRILERIDYGSLREHPKIIAGFSDLTALHLAVARKARLVTFHAPMPQASLWRQDGDFAYAAASCRRALFAESYPHGAKGFTIDLPPGQKPPLRVVGGRARGRLVGGNLTLIGATLGTPYGIEAKGRILFIEDVGEAPYRTDRMLSQLRLAGILDGVAGVVVGQFTETDADETARVLREYLGRLKVPVLSNFPVGHGPWNATLPHGALVEIDADQGSLRVLDNPVLVD